MKKLNKKVVIITGASKGIGKETAIKMAKEGAKVYACSRTKTDFNDSSIIYHALDVTSNKSCKELFDDVVKENGKIDVLVCNAGIVADSLTEKMKDSAFNKVINTNLKGVFNLVKCIGPYMERQGYGSIIAISSVVGEQGNIGQANYAASKAGLIGMCKSWAKEFARKGSQVRVNVVAPGYIETDMLKGVKPELLEKFSKQTMLKRLGKPIEVANAISFLASDEASYITGAVIDVNGGIRL